VNDYGRKSDAGFPTQAAGSSAMATAITTSGRARTEKPFTVPVKIKSRHMANKIMKDAGLPKAF
jgi:hypothetical protein